ncbi:hypothetical protein Acr_00g0044570 [Actinidia rufa]|uniref:Uncharacterized protein n=1 Tax=Actinidia rufa TaxID=165716 RepID=A0A7J0DJ42_9ERIC|nr:hypothetical protein Acr_00g0044570 [Actinidia rufa]
MYKRFFRLGSTKLIKGHNFKDMELSCRNLAKWWRISLRTANRRFFLGSSSETRPDLVGNSPRSRRKRAPNSQSPTGAMAVRDLLGNLPDEARFDTDEGRFDFERLPLCSVTRQQASPVLR